MKIRWLILLIVGLALVAGAAYAMRIADQAGVGAAAMAKVTCSCVFVEGRDLKSCRADDPPGFEAVATEVDAAAKSVTGRVLGVISRRATYSDSYGCTLVP